PEVALEQADRCEQTNRKRRQLCEQIEKEAIALVESTPIPWKENRVLVVVSEGWHHGVIGIVASRLVERYGVPVFIGTYEEEEESKTKSKQKKPTMIRGSARSIDEFNVFDALNYCDDLLGKYGGHRAAGGFSFLAENLEQVKKRLSEFAHKCLEVEHLKPLVKVDAQASFSQIDFELYQQLEGLQPWGIGNSPPVFWTSNVRVVEQRAIGKTKEHLKLSLQEANSDIQIKALAWRWGEYCPLPEYLDLAYKLQENHWQGNTSIELELVGVRLPKTPLNNNIEPISKPLKNSNVQKAVFTYNSRIYYCSKGIRELRIRNDKGNILAVNQGNRTGLLGKSRDEAKEVNVTKEPYFQLIKAALKAIEEENWSTDERG
ncbi:MAG: DHH family phosphoesterase, partial [Pleurocapsa sp.]